MVEGQQGQGRPCKGELETGRGADFRLIQPLDITAIKTAIIRSPDRRIAGSPDRRIAGSPDRRIAGSPDRRIAGSPFLRLDGFAV